MKIQNPSIQVLKLFKLYRLRQVMYPYLLKITNRIMLLTKNSNQILVVFQNPNQREFSKMPIMNFLQELEVQVKVQNDQNQKPNLTSLVAEKI